VFAACQGGARGCPPSDLAIYFRKDHFNVTVKFLDFEHRPTRKRSSRSLKKGNSKSKKSAS
jgi:hypothetical protein